MNQNDANNDPIPEAPPVERFPFAPAIVIEWKDQENDNYFASKNFQGIPGVHASVTDIDLFDSTLPMNSLI